MRFKVFDATRRGGPWRLQVNLGAVEVGVATQRVTGEAMVVGGSHLIYPGFILPPPPPAQKSYHPPQGHRINNAVLTTAFASLGSDGSPRGPRRSAPGL